MNGPEARPNHSTRLPLRWQEEPGFVLVPVARSTPPAPKPPDHHLPLLLERINHPLVPASQAVDL